MLRLQHSCLLGWFLGRFGWRGCLHRHLPPAAAVVCLSSSTPVNVAIFSFTFFGCPIFHTFPLAFLNITWLFQSREKRTPHHRDTCRLIARFCVTVHQIHWRGVIRRKKTRRYYGQKIPPGAGAACSCLMLNRGLAFYLIPPLSATLSAVLTTSHLILFSRCQQNAIM